MNSLWKLFKNPNRVINILSIHILGEVYQSSFRGLFLQDCSYFLIHSLALFSYLQFIILFFKKQKNKSFSGGKKMIERQKKKTLLFKHLNNKGKCAEIDIINYFLFQRIGQFIRSAGHSVHWDTRQGRWSSIKILDNLQSFILSQCENFWIWNACSSKFIWIKSKDSRISSES